MCVCKLFPGNCCHWSLCTQPSFPRPCGNIHSMQPFSACFLTVLIPIPQQLKIITESFISISPRTEFDLQLLYLCYTKNNKSHFFLREAGSCHISRSMGMRMIQALLIYSDFIQLCQKPITGGQMNSGTTSRESSTI